MGPRTLVTNIVQNIFFCVRNVYRFGITWGGSKLWHSLHFWVDYPFKNMEVFVTLKDVKWLPTFTETIFFFNWKFSEILFTFFLFLSILKI